jgi:hypothetical protein
VGTEADFRGSGAALFDGGQTRMVVELASVPAIDTRSLV